MKVSIITKIYEAPDKLVKIFVEYTKLKNVDLIIALVTISILFWSWERGLGETFAWLINLIFPNKYGVPRTRVLSEWFILLPLMYALGYLHYAIKKKLQKKYYKK
jgi:hypothetical protein